MVGQQFVNLLENHPWFEVVCLAASARSANKTYEEAVSGRWKLEQPCPDYVKEITVRDARADLDDIAEQVDVIFCALDMDAESIRQLENGYASAGVAVISNNSAHRWSEDVPMIIPEVNAAHSELINTQRQQRGWTTGLIAVKPNCSIQSYTIALEALKAFEPLAVSVTSLQAVSGAGKTLDDWPEMTDNVIPFIGGEEEKSEREPLQIWGRLAGEAVKPASSPSITARCVRVPVSNGHLADVSVKFAKQPSENEILAALEAFAAPLAELGLPSSPQKLIHYEAADDRPQAKLDRDREKGMAVTLGRLRKLSEDNPYDWGFMSLAHNTVRGAAGGGILMAELLVAKGYIKP